MLLRSILRFNHSARATWTAAAWCSRRLPAPPPRPRRCKGCSSSMTQEVLTGANATEAKLKQLHGPRILHVATHGFFLSDQEISAAALRPVGFGAETNTPCRSARIRCCGRGSHWPGPTRGALANSDDGILTAAEAAQLDLRGTQLVVLSACETGLGRGAKWRGGVRTSPRAGARRRADAARLPVEGGRCGDQGADGGLLRTVCSRAKAARRRCVRRSVR